jgi:GNAT superfamily N-acetyltransferase
MSNVVVRLAMPGDLPDLRSAMVELQEHERRLAATRLPGEQIADPYLARLQREAAEKRGAILVVESDGVFAGFAAGWIIERDHIPETKASNRFGYLSDICIMPAFRGKRIAHQLMAAMERHFASAGVTRFVFSPWRQIRQLARAMRARALHPTRYFTKSSWTARTRLTDEPTSPTRPPPIRAIGSAADLKSGLGRSRAMPRRARRSSITADETSRPR